MQKGENLYGSLQVPGPDSMVPDIVIMGKQIESTGNVPSFIEIPAGSGAMVVAGKSPENLPTSLLPRSPSMKWPVITLLFPVMAIIISRYMAPVRKIQSCPRVPGTVHALRMAADTLVGSLYPPLGGPVALGCVRTNDSDCDRGTGSYLVSPGKHLGLHQIL